MYESVISYARTQHDINPELAAIAADAPTFGLNHKDEAVFLLISSTIDAMCCACGGDPRFIFIHKYTARLSSGEIIAHDAIDEDDPPPIYTAEPSDVHRIDQLSIKYREYMAAFERNKPLLSARGHAAQVANNLSIIQYEINNLVHAEYDRQISPGHLARMGIHPMRARRRSCSQT